MADPPSTSPPRLRARNIEFLRKQAKALLRDYQRGDPHARLRISAVFPKIDGVPSRDSIGLAEAQLALARELGFSSWPRLARQINGSDATVNLGDQVMTTQTTDTLGLSAIDQIGLSCTDLDEAQRFYCDVLGLRYGGEAGPSMKFFDCAGVNIIMFKGDTVSPGSVIYFRVEGEAGMIQRKIEMLKERGVKIESEPRCIANNWHGYDVWLAFFRDPFGNLLSLKSDVQVGR